MKANASKHCEPSRRSVFFAGLSALFLPACEAKPMTLNFDVTVFSYLDRPIFDIYISDQLGTSTRPYPATGGGTITGVSLPAGPQKVVWTLDGPEGKPRNGEVVTAKNLPLIKDEARNFRHLMLHIYPDDTVELTFSERYSSQPSARGEVEIEKIRSKNGK